VVVDDSGTVTFANDVFRSIFGPDAPDRLRFGQSDSHHPPAALTNENASAPGAADRLADDAGAMHAVTWCRTGPDCWTGTVVLPGRKSPHETSMRHDALTGLGDRSSLSIAFQTLLDQRGGADIPVMAACVDLDRFKRVNDTLGHLAGDELLRKVSRRLVSSVRRSDVVIRMGGDEFTILLEGSTQAEVEDMAARIIDVLARPFVVMGHQVIIGASIGLAALLPAETDPSELMRRADVALYKSKNSGRGCFSWFEDGMFAALDERRLLEADLRKALLLDEFELAFQSQFDFHTNSITGFEALLRWKHRDRGIVSPADFIPIAEETGEILKIGAWVLRQACQTAMSWPDTLMIAVNVSPVQFEADGFVESVLTALALSGLAPCRLELELTETVLLSEDKIVIERMGALRAAGVKLSLDDFGTGYSSLNYLRKYPFTKVKIDQSFIRAPAADENAHRIVTAVAGLGIAMGMSVIAEGVETEDQLSRIRFQGCSAAQGYLFSRPIRDRDVMAYLQAAKASGFHPQDS